MRLVRTAVFVAVSLLVAISAGCGPSSEDRVQEGSSTTRVSVDPAIEVFRDEAGASVALPETAVPNEPVRVAALGNLEGLPPTGDPESFAGGIRLEPHGLEFTDPVTVTIPLTRQQPPGRQVRLLYWDGEGTAWEETEFVAVVHDDGWTASAEVTHFSYYVLMPSAIQAEADGIFGNLLEAVSVATSRGGDEVAATEAVFSSMIGNVNARFPLHQRVLLDVPIPNGHNCYAPVGYFFLFDHARPEGLEEPLELDYGDLDDVEFRIDYVRDVDVSVKQGEVEIQVAGTLVANIYWKSVPPEMSLTADREIIGPGDSATLHARLRCGESPMGKEKVAFVDHSGAGTLTPPTAKTGKGGTVDSVFSPGSIGSDRVVVSAEYDWTNQRGDVSLVVDDWAEFAIRSVTGTWTVNGQETWTGCLKPEDNGTYRGSGHVYFTELDGTISGYGEFPRSSDLIVGTIVWSGNSFTLRGTSNYREDYGGWTVTGTTEFTGHGTLGSAITFTWDGQDLTGDTCTFHGKGTATLGGE